MSLLDGHVRAFTAWGGVPARVIYDNLKPAVKRLVGRGERELTKPFLALATHYAFEPCFARPGEGHDKGGVEARGKGLRGQHLVPIPTGESLAAINRQLTAQVATQAAQRCDRQGVTVAARWAAEQPQLHGLPARPFAAERLVPVTVNSQALVRVSGADYSVPSAWQRLTANAHEGVESVRIVCRDEEVTHPRVPRGQRCVRYTHYLDELARKPQALRPVAPALLAELGAPYQQLWAVLEATHGGHQAARLFAGILAALRVLGPGAVDAAVAAVVASGAPAGSSLGALRPAPPRLTLVPPRLAAVSIESARAADFDCLLAGGAP